MTDFNASLTMLQAIAQRITLAADPANVAVNRLRSLLDTDRPSQPALAPEGPMAVLKLVDERLYQIGTTEMVSCMRGIAGTVVINYRVTGSPRATLGYWKDSDQILKAWPDLPAEVYLLDQDEDPATLLGWRPIGTALAAMFSPETLDQPIKER